MLVPCAQKIQLSAVGRRRVSTLLSVLISGGVQSVFPATRTNRNRTETYHSTVDGNTNIRHTADNVNSRPDTDFYPIDLRTPADCGASDDRSDKHRGSVAYDRLRGLVDRRRSDDRLGMRRISAEDAANAHGDFAF